MRTLLRSVRLHRIESGRSVCMSVSGEEGGGVARGLPGVFNLAVQYEFPSGETGNQCESAAVGAPNLDAADV